MTLLDIIVSIGDITEEQSALAWTAESHYDREAPFMTPAPREPSCKHHHHPLSIMRRIYSADDQRPLNIRRREDVRDGRGGLCVFGVRRSWHLVPGFFASGPLVAKISSESPAGEGEAKVGRY